MRILEPIPRRLGREGMLPPALKLMVLFGINASVERADFGRGCSYFYYVWCGEILSGVAWMGKGHYARGAGLEEIGNESVFPQIFSHTQGIGVVFC
jgi:hypothetical protein